MNSEYYRLIGIPETASCIIGAGFAAIMMLVPLVIFYFAKVRHPSAAARRR
jgi:hypothetical protein